VIADAQTLAATAFGAEQTWFLVNGCTVGIQAAVMSCAGPGETLLVARNNHLSVVSAMVLAGK
jgi:arginine decarboxylase